MGEFRINSKLDDILLLAPSTPEVLVENEIQSDVLIWVIGFEK